MRPRRGALAAVGIVSAAIVVSYAAMSPVSLAPVSADTGLVLTESGDLDATVRSFVDRIPRRETEGYDPPSADEAAAMADAWRQVRAGNLQGAADRAAPFSYEVVRLTDSSTKRVSVVLRERQRTDGRWPHGWGLYVFTPSARSSLVVQAPHPVADVRSEAVAVASFRRANARALFVAGAHRDANRDGSADVAHRDDSVFEAIHRATLDGGAVVNSVHGYGSSTTTAADAIVSRGAAPSATTTRVASAIRNAGFTVCVYDGTRCSDLAGTTNVQGRSARAAGRQFVHVEIARVVRDDVARRTRLANAVATALT